ncbi:hypothetical protein J14TS2_00200 [Bacillus sp. J14TS2]|uniref:alpha-hydroxy-acid oxidizing protein n=1 Tax=Bacillus sp. J14TS2 TaxID=2807188 RepID=UPI001B0E1D57|nr:alpha-hydroxy-acid oxidizing protein [Bacillus sp. J14TS2]GIN69545.1 hypothetical protein J14TS2_00200 [Bacillus sp. J14TS2]
MAKKLTDVGIAFIGVAGADGTSWSQVEKFRAKDKVKAEAAEAFSEWGIPPAKCVLSVRKQIEKQPIVASVGMRTGLDAAKAIAIGADMLGFGRSILKEATQSRSNPIDRRCYACDGNARIGTKNGHVRNRLFIFSS